jgi:hypothetical protein
LFGLELRDDRWWEGRSTHRRREINYYSDLSYAVFGYLQQPKRKIEKKERKEEKKMATLCLHMVRDRTWRFP